MKDLLKIELLPFIAIPIILSIIGVIFILSTGQLENGLNTNLYIKQILWIILGLGIVAIILSIDYYYIIEMSVVYYILGIGLLIFTLVFGKEIKGSKSWLGVAGLGIQISELMKIFYILFYAKFLSKISKDEKSIQTFFKALFILILPLSLVLMQPDLGTALIFCSIFLIMSLIGLNDISILLTGIAIFITTGIILAAYTYYQFYLATHSTPPNHIIEILLSPKTFLAIAIIFLIYTVITFIIELLQPIPWISKFTKISLMIGVSFLMTSIISRVMKPYQWNRLFVFINPEFDKLGSGYNSIQAQIAIGAGGAFGQGILKGSQNLRGFLPEKHTDFIFAILAEETGFFGSSFVVLLYALYTWLIVKTIISAKDPEGAYIACGLLAMYVTHIFINIGMNIGIAPVTGLPLPFISYGGSSYIVSIAGAALLLNIYKRRFTN
ncbi:MAG: FtsW/RodA/SpoVE family cell cycle protein [Brevinemataceae bacterium]